MDPTISLIIEGFEQYMEEFRAITCRAADRFARQDWPGIQQDAHERITLYKRKVYQVVRTVKRSLGAGHRDLSRWQALHAAYAQAVSGRVDTELAETFFNSICRKVWAPLGADSRMMFVAAPPLQRPSGPRIPITRQYPLDRPLGQILAQVLTDFAFTVPFEDLPRDIGYMEAVLQATGRSGPDLSGKLEMLKSVFYRNKGAYLVGHLHTSQGSCPLMIPLLHGEDGIFADTLLLDVDECAIVFSFARSYFLVETDLPVETVRFLQTLMPHKLTSDLYNAIGFNKHGKTVLYWDFVQHMAETDDLLVAAPGIPGLVMAVFTLPSYPIVFKLIKDKIAPPKVTTRGEVRGKYRWVKTHDRVGRLADTHEFQHFVLPKDRFSPTLLAHLLEVAPSIVHVDGQQVIIDHLYTERKMIPLNLFLDQATREEMALVVAEYGDAIKQMAAANIFPGDMFLKNFGVTRQRRVVFYDYDEIGLLTDYHFREMPQAQTYEDLYAQSPWFAVGEKDVFPQEFRHFLVGREDMQEVFCHLHSDLFEVSFWQAMQERQTQGELIDIFPYGRHKRFRDR